MALALAIAASSRTFLLALAVGSTVLATGPVAGAGSGPTCNGEAATIVRGGGAQTIVGTPQRDVIVAGGGQDEIRARGGADLICGDGGDEPGISGGSDDIDGGGGADKIWGEGGADFLEGGTGDDDLYQEQGALGELRGGPDDDFLGGGPEANDRLFGGPGTDTLKGRAGVDHLFGEGGRDELEGGDDDDTLSGGPKNDELDGMGGGDELSGGGGDDTLFGAGNLAGATDGKNTLKGGDGEDTLHVGRGGGLAEGGPDRDELNGAQGEDELLGGGGRDDLEGAGGRDLLGGGPGNDFRMDGGAADDTLVGSAGSDRLAGAQGNDTLLGGEDDDTLDGGPDSDNCDGGPGTDTEENCEGYDLNVKIIESGDPVSPGTITYRYEVTNVGFHTARAVALTIRPLPADPQAACSSFPEEIRSLGDIESLQTVTGTYTVTCEGAGQVRLFMSAFGEPNIEERDPSDNAPIESTTIQASGPNALKVTVLPPTPESCVPQGAVEPCAVDEGPSTWRVQVTNPGPPSNPAGRGSAEGVQVTLRLITPADVSCQPNPPPSLSFGNVALGATEERSFTIACQVDGGAYFQVCVDADARGSDGSSGQDTACQYYRNSSS